MSRLVAKKTISELSQRYQGVKNCVFINYQPLNALQTTDLRSYLRESDIKINVLKNTLAHRIFEKNHLKNVQQFLEGPTAIVYAIPGGKGDDAIQLAKKIVTWRDKIKIMQIRGGLLEGRIVTLPEIRQIAVLPPREAILGQIAGTLNAPMAHLAAALNGLANKMGGLLKSLLDKREKGA